MGSRWLWHVIFRPLFSPRTLGGVVLDRRLGWYDDPWKHAQYRYWDGRAWTGYTSGPVPAPQPPNVGASNINNATKIGTWGVRLMAGTVIMTVACVMAGPAVRLAPSSAVTAPTVRFVAELLVSGTFLLSAVGTIVCGIWLFINGLNGAALNIPYRMNPVYLLFAFLLPILSFFVPPIVLHDAVPHGTRLPIIRWWSLMVTIPVLQFFAMWSMGNPDDPFRIEMTMIGVGLCITQGCLGVLQFRFGRQLVTGVNDTHRRILESAQTRVRTVSAGIASTNA